MKKILGLLTVGQSPRADILPLLREVLGPAVILSEKGALDGLSPSDLAALAPPPGVYPIATRLADGSQATVSKQALVPAINARLREFRDEGVKIVALLCTGEFPPLEVPSEIFLLRAQAILDNTIAALASKSLRLGVLVPLAGQKAHALELYPGLFAGITAASASPYGPEEEMAKAASDLAGADLIVMHCMGYARVHRDLLQKASGRPILQANAMVARVAAELLGV